MRSAWANVQSGRVIIFHMSSTLCRLFLVVTAGSSLVRANDQRLGRTLVSDLVPALRGSEREISLRQGAGEVCQCQTTAPSWAPCNRTVPKCVFMDLGAGDGGELRQLIKGGFGPLANCPGGGQWEAILVEADPGFQTSLQLAVAEHPSCVNLELAAPYMCDATATFNLDTQRPTATYFKDFHQERFQQVRGRTANINRLIYERTIPGDWVMVILKSDMRTGLGTVGMLPCLSMSPASSLIDRLYLEWSGVTPEISAAVAVLQQRGVNVQTGYHPQPAFPNL